MAEDSPNGPTCVGAVIAVLAAAGNGRTSMVSNLAWIFASNGRKVLVLDWGTEQPTVHSYLQRFVVDAIPPVLDVLDRSLTTALTAAVEPGPVEDSGARDRRPLALHLQRYALHGLKGAEDIDVVSCGALGEARRVLLTDLPSADVAALRQSLRTTGYDYVLVDAPTDASATATTMIAQLCDVAVVIFTSGHTAVVEAERRARALLSGAPDDIEIVAAASLYDMGTSPEARHDRSVVRRVFNELRSTGSVALVEIPYRPRYPANAILAVLVDEPGNVSTLAVAYEKVADAVTAGVITAQEPVPPRVRARYRLSHGLADPNPSDIVWLAYAPRDRPWADWVAAQLRFAGVRTNRLSFDGSESAPLQDATVLVVVSEHFGDSRAHNGLLARTAPGLNELDLIGIHVTSEAVEDQCTVPLPILIDLRGFKEHVARKKLLETLGLFERAGMEPTVSMPFPGTDTRSEEVDSDFPTTTELPEISGLPPRNPQFVGQEDRLEALRDRLAPLDAAAEAGGLRWATVSGPAGVGKSEIVREYAHLFTRAYDVIWWIPAGERQSVRSSLDELGARLGVGRTGDAAQAALAQLARRKSKGRWLLVYDNAVSRMIEGLLPDAGAGDVIITTTEDPVRDSGSPTPVEGLSPADSCALLQSPIIGVPALSKQDGGELAAKVGHLPLALQLVAAWLRERSARLQRQQFHAPRALAMAVTELRTRLNEPTGKNSEPAGSQPMSRLLALSVDALRDNNIGRIAVVLAQMCVFLDSHGVTVQLLRSSTMLAQLAAASGLAGDIVIRDEAELDRVLWAGARFGLFQVDRGSPASLRMHRVLQDSLRDTMERKELEVRQAQVLRGLAAYAMVIADLDSPSSGKFAELQKHLISSGVADLDFAAMVEHLGPAEKPGSDGWAVRRWVVAQVGYLGRMRDREIQQSAAEFAEKVEESWAAAFGPTDNLRSLLATELAALYRDLGHHEKALNLDMDTVARQRRDIGIAHPRTLMTARGLGGDLRALGRFEEALAEDEATWWGFRESFGDDHPQTLMVASNLAMSRFHMGRVREALQLEESSYHLRMRVLGADHQSIWRSGRNLAIYLGELSKYDEALRCLVKAMDRVQRNHPNHDHREELRIQRIHIVTERRKILAEHGTDAQPYARLQRRSRELLGRYRERFGEDHNFTHACKLSHAVDMHLGSESPSAVELGEECLRSYIEKFSAEHPITNACRANLAVFQRGAGETTQALANGKEALARLQDKLGDTHPWALAAAVNRAHTLAVSDAADAALELLTSTHDHCREYLGDDNLSTKIATGNLKVMRQLTIDGVAQADRGWRDIDIDLY